MLRRISDSISPRWIDRQRLRVLTRSLVTPETVHRCDGRFSGLDKILGYLATTAIAADPRSQLARIESLSYLVSTKRSWQYCAASKADGALHRLKAWNAR